MTMIFTITMTSKGQFTLPAGVRKALALKHKGDRLTLDFNPDRQQVILSKPVSFAAIQARAKRFITPGTPPLADVDAFYNTRDARQ